MNGAQREPAAVFALRVVAGVWLGVWTVIGAALGAIVRYGRDGDR